MNELPVAMVADAFEYEPDTGLLRWKRPAGRFGRMPAGSIAGCKNDDGYLHVSFAGRKVKAHRIAFALMTGEWPDGVVDHKNMDRSDNRWENLRVTTRSLNKANQRMRTDSRNKFKGVTRQRNGGFVATITKCGNRMHLGCFSSEVDAARAYARAANLTFGEYARTT